MENLKTEGSCLYCKKMFGATGMGRHLSAHLKKKEKESPGRSKAYHLKITGGPVYFLHALIHEKLCLYDLDDFLRAIWLECCGHMSAFKVKGKKYSWDYDTDEFGEKKNKAVGKIFEKGMILSYDYDFGSTTYLEIKVMGEYKMKAANDIVLLTRNEPPKIVCHVCKKKPAKVLCMDWHEDGNVFCEACGELHHEVCEDFGDGDEIPLTNSPRTGVCAYMGGTIDTKRDGVWTGE